jgi:hypothetical protein
VKVISESGFHSLACILREGNGGVRHFLIFLIFAEFREAASAGAADRIELLL